MHNGDVEMQIDISFAEAFPNPEVGFSKQPKARSDTKDGKDDSRLQESIGLHLLPKVGWDRRQVKMRSPENAYTTEG